METKWLESFGRWSRTSSSYPSLISTFYILILVWKTEMLLMTKLPSMLQKQFFNAKLVLNVQPLLQMKQELRNSSLKKCGNLLMVPLETILEELCSESLLSLKMFPDSFLLGKNQSSLEDMLLVINTEPLILRLKKLVPSKLFSPLRMVEKSKWWRSMITQLMVELVWECTTQLILFLSLLILASYMLFKDKFLFISLLRTQFLRHMMESSRTFSRKFLKNNMQNNSRKLEYGMNIDSLMIWLHTW